MKRRVAFVDVPKKNTKRSATSALVYKRGALRASAHARDERLLLRLDAQQRLVLHLQTLEFPPPLARGRGLHRGVASPPLRRRRRLVALAHRAQLLALRRRRLSRRVSSWVREEEARGHGARVSERNRRGRYATRDATSEHAAPSRGDGGDDAPEGSPVPPTRKNGEKKKRRGVSFVSATPAEDARRTCRSTASTTVATVSLSCATLSQKSRAVSASSCVRAYFSESSTRTRYAWGDAAEEEGERTR